MTMRVMTLPPFHFAFPVDDLAARAISMGGCSVAPRGAAPSSGSTSTSTAIRSSPILRRTRRAARASNAVDGEDVPVPHFGLVLAMDEWKSLAERLEAASVEFVIPPTVRFAGQPGEQATMFLLDPAGNALEFKAMADPANLFAQEQSLGSARPGRVEADAADAAAVGVDALQPPARRVHAPIRLAGGCGRRG